MAFSLPETIVIFVTLTGVFADIFVFQQDPFHDLAEEFKDMPARFGDSIPFGGFKGMLIVADPLNACAPIAKPPKVSDNFTGKWIALIRRYDCSFEEKVRIAQNASYDAVVVYNVNSSDLEPMSAKDPLGIHIPAVFVSDIDGLLLKDNYQYLDGYYLVITNDLPFNFNMHLLLPFAIVVGICFLVMLIFMIIKCIKDRRRQRRYRLPSSSLNKIPTCKFTKGDPYETCAICLEDYVEGEKLRVLPCAHAYHCKCIDPWLTKNRRVCPVCKRKVFAHDEHPEPDSESESEADDTTPLVTPSNRPRTQGGTFAQQRENPFQRARRTFSTLSERQNRPQNTSAPSSEDTESHRSSSSSEHSPEASHNDSADSVSQTSQNSASKRRSNFFARVFRPASQNSQSTEERPGRSFVNDSGNHSINGDLDEVHSSDVAEAVDSNQSEPTVQISGEHSNSRDFVV